MEQRHSLKTRLTDLTRLSAASVILIILTLSFTCPAKTFAWGNFCSSVTGPSGNLLAVGHSYLGWMHIRWGACINILRIRSQRLCWGELDSRNGQLYCN